MSSHTSPAATSPSPSAIPGRRYSKRKRSSSTAFPDVLDPPAKIPVLSPSSSAAAAAAASASASVASVASAASAERATTATLITVGQSVSNVPNSLLSSLSVGVSTSGKTLSSTGGGESEWDHFYNQVLYVFANHVRRSGNFANLVETNLEIVQANGLREVDSNRVAEVLIQAFDAFLKDLLFKSNRACIYRQSSYDPLPSTAGPTGTQSHLAASPLVTYPVDPIKLWRTIERVEREAEVARREAAQRRREEASRSKEGAAGGKSKKGSKKQEIQEAKDLMVAKQSNELVSLPLAGKHWWISGGSRAGGASTGAASAAAGGGGGGGGGGKETRPTKFIPTYSKPTRDKIRVTDVCWALEGEDRRTAGQERILRRAYSRRLKSFKGGSKRLAMLPQQP